MMMVSQSPLWRWVRKRTEDYLCTVELRKHGEEMSIEVAGDPDRAEAFVQSTFSGPPPDNIVRTRRETFKTRILDQIKEVIETGGLGPLRGPTHWAEVDIESESLTIYSLPPASSAEIFKRIYFWLKQEGYHQFSNCGCCLDFFNGDQGVYCPNGHFFCTADCFDGLVSSQEATLRSNSARLVCPVCASDFLTQNIAKRVSDSTWARLETLIIDARMTTKVAEMEKQFDATLRQKVSELEEQYAEAEPGGRLKLEASRLAREALDLLNLKCPHCSAVYAEFDGCMALKCGSCAQRFCGYCHHGFCDSSACHAHVRRCDLNHTPDGNYFLSEEALPAAHSRYRVKVLKKFLDPKKKDLQNAIVMELAVDLRQLNIDPHGLFDFGNLRPPEDM